MRKLGNSITMHWTDRNLAARAALAALAAAKIRGPKYVALDHCFTPITLPEEVSGVAHQAAPKAMVQDPPAALGTMSTRELSDDEEAELMSWADVAAHLEPFYKYDTNVAEEIVKALDETVTTYRRTKHLPLPEFTDETDLAMALGAWLGYALKSAGFKLVSIGDDEVAIVPEDGSWALLPLRFMYRMLTDAAATNTTILTCNMCKAGRVAGSPGQYRTIT